MPTRREGDARAAMARAVEQVRRRQCRNERGRSQMTGSAPPGRGTRACEAVVADRHGGCRASAVCARLRRDKLRLWSSVRPCGTHSTGKRCCPFGDDSCHSRSGNTVLRGVPRAWSCKVPRAISATTAREAGVGFRACCSQDHRRARRRTFTFTRRRCGRGRRRRLWRASN